MLLKHAIAAFVPLIGIVDALGHSTVNFKDIRKTLDNENSSTLGASPQAYKVKVLRKLTHAGMPWTQGLEWVQQGTRYMLIETSGDYPQGKGSFVRSLDINTGKEIMRSTEGFRMFFEGITQKDDHWFISTYHDHKILEFDARMQHIADHPFPYEGWGLTYDSVNHQFLATNSTAALLFIDPHTFKTRDVKEVTCMGKSVKGLNELEFVPDWYEGGPVIMGNLINSRVVLVLDPHTAKCIGTFHLQGLEFMDIKERMGYHVANGIAYDPSQGTFYATGKNWKNIFELKIEKEPIVGLQEANVLLKAMLEMEPAAGAIPNE